MTISVHQPQILRRYHIIVFALIWATGWLVGLVQTIAPIIDEILDLAVMVIVALISIPIMLALNCLRIAL